MKYSLVVPIYNNSKGISDLYDAISSYFNTESVEFIFVDDFSQDTSWAELKKIRAKDQRCKIIRLSKNFGQHAATLCGFAESKGEIVLTLDDDLEVLPAEFQKLIDKQEATKAKVVYGEYQQKESSFKRLLKGIYKRVSKLEGAKKGRGSSFRLIDGQIARKLAESHKQFVFIDEFLLWYTHEVEFVTVTNNPSALRKSRYKTKGLIKTTANVVMYSTAIPLKAVTLTGFTLAAVNFLIGIFFLRKYLIDKIEIKGYTSLIVSILFSTGLIIFCIGVIAQYMRAILTNLNNAPTYHISDKEC
jgi:undecaprenyl-phosphate 4-deoxy-4-formamido-L-arabinose transferase